MPEAKANIGVVGLAVMGSNLARNLASREGNTVAVLNRSRAKTDELIAEHPEAGFIPTFSYEEFAAVLQRPRTAAGKAPRPDFRRAPGGPGCDRALRRGMA